MRQGWWWRCWRFAVAGGFPSLSLSSVFFCFLLCGSFFFFFFCVLPSLSFPLSLLSLLFFSPSLGSFFCVFFVSALPCIYRKTGEGNVLGRPLLAAPSTTFQQIKSQASGWLRASYCVKHGKEIRRKGEEKIFFFPCLARPGEEEELQCRQNGTVLGFCFFFFCNSEWKRRRFI